MATKKYDIVIKAGEYTNNQGETKSRWVNVGAVMQGEDGFFALLDPGVNLAAYKQDGKDRVIASLFDSSRSQQNTQQQAKQQPQQQPSDMEDFDDFIPF